MWIARMENGDTLTQNDYDYSYLDHSKINSLQLLYNGRFFTVTRGNKTQVLIFQGVSQSYQPLKGGKSWSEHVGSRIYCVKDHISRCVGWGLNFKNGTAYYVDFIAYEPKDAFHHFNFRREEIVDNNKTKVFVSELDVRKRKASEWTCVSCAVINTDKDKQCHYCKAPRRIGEDKE